MKIALCQLNPTVGAIQENSLKALQALKTAYDQGAALALFPELFLLGYPAQDLLLNPAVIEECEKALCDLYEKSPIPLIIGLPTTNQGDCGPIAHNSVALVEPGKSCQFYHKTLLPNYDVFSEPRYFLPGGQQQNPFCFIGKKCAVLICEDIWAGEQHEERLRYLQDPTSSIGQVDIVITLSASPFQRNKEALRKRLLKQLAEKLKAPVAFVNQVGGQDGILFDGGSTVVFPNGATIKTEQFQEEVFLVDLANSNKNVSKTVALNTTQELLQACVMGVRDFFQKQNFSKALLGLSGGIDSALVACIATLALGKENVEGVLLPSRFTSNQSTEDALALANEIGIRTKTISIEPVLTEYEKTLLLTEGIAFENLQARIRGTILMTLSNQEGALLLTTSNKSELAMGYFTLYGDACGALAPLGDLLKREVYEIANYLHTTMGWIPKSILNREPTAELRPGQKDSDSLPPYSILDILVDLFVCNNSTLEEVLRHGQFDLKSVKQVYNSIQRMEFKRRQCPTVLKVSPKAFCCGRTYPIVNKFYSRT